jgi:hypothetical protein
VADCSYQIDTLETACCAEQWLSCVVFISTTNASGRISSAGEPAHYGNTIKGKSGHEARTLTKTQKEKSVFSEKQDEIDEKCSTHGKVKNSYKNGDSKT